MVLAAKAGLQSDDVAAAVSRSYASAGDTVVETPFGALVDTPEVGGSAVIAADAGIVECVLDETVDPGDVGPGIARLAAAGWTVVALVPLARLGEAHRSLRRVQARLQPWWADPDRGVCFGAPEVP